MRSYLSILFFIAPLFSSAQNTGSGSNNGLGNITRTATVQGTITVPSLHNLSVDFSVNNFQMKFDNFDQRDDGREYPSALHVHIKSNEPWVIKVKSNDAFHQSTSTSASTNVPPSIIQIRQTGTGNYMPITTAPQTILMNTNTNIENDYYLDLKLTNNYNDNFRGGLYSLNVGFSISAP